MPTSTLIMIIFMTIALATQFISAIEKKCFKFSILFAIEIVLFTAILVDVSKY